MENQEPGTETKKPRVKFQWNEKLSYSCLQIYCHNKPYQYKSASKESVDAWDQILKDLAMADPMFANVTLKQVRDHLNLVLRNRETLVKALDRQSGIDVQETPMQQLMDQIISERKEHIEFFTSQKEVKKTEGRRRRE